MNGYQAAGAGSPFTFFDSSDINMDLASDQSAFINGQQQTMHSQPTSFEHSPAEQFNQSRNWPTTNVGFSRPTYPPHWSVSSYSSTSSHGRLSDISVFSHLQNRASTVSTDSSLSGISNLSRSHYFSQAEHLLTGQSSAHTSYAPSPVEIPAPQPPRKRNTPRTPAPEKDYYKTCVSRKQRARRAETAQTYFCTVCREPFREKADWKRHEETYQERPEEFQCDSCHAKYFLDKDFVTHHVQTHRCVHCDANTKCSQKKHVQEARRSRQTRTGWGCGFCYYFSTNWSNRCNHIAHHFDTEGKTMEQWNHSSVIYSLLQRPAILREWNAILERKKRAFIGFGWDQQSTGRVEGYPDSNPTLQLQDELEFFTPYHNAAALARKAFDLAVTKVDRGHPDVAPPVPPKPKDYRVKHKASLQDIMKDTQSLQQIVRSMVNDDQQDNFKDTESLQQFVQSICHDDLFPTGVTQLANGALDDDHSSWFDASL